jgi:hypothetical protein
MSCGHLAAGLLWIGTAAPQQYVISTYAGGALLTPVPGLEVSIAAPTGICTDAADIARGADPNPRAAIDGDGFGGHTPLFNAIVCGP